MKLTNNEKKQIFHSMNRRAEIMASEQNAKVSVPTSITTHDGREILIPTPRPMTYKERKRFRAAGCDMAFIPASEREEQSKLAQLTEDMIDWILNEIYDGKDNPWYEDVPYSILAELAKATYQITYGVEANIKN